MTQYTGESIYCTLGNRVVIYLGIDTPENWGNGSRGSEFLPRGPGALQAVLWAISP